MGFQHATQLAGDPDLVRDEEPQSELIVGEVYGVGTSIDHGDALEGPFGNGWRISIILRSCPRFNDNPLPSLYR